MVFLAYFNTQVLQTFTTEVNINPNVADYLLPVSITLLALETEGLETN